jgi:predicted Zn-dependent peptidase
VLAVSGKITKSLRRAIDSLEKYKAFYVEQKTPEARRTPKIQGQTIKVIKGHKPQAMIQMAFSAPLMTDTENDTLAYLASMYLGYDQSSRLMQAVRTKHGLCYGIHSMVESTSAFGMGHIYTQVDPKNIKKTIDIVWSEIESIKHHGISTDEFKRLITSYKTAATLAGDDLEFDAKTDAEYMVERVPHRSRAHSDRMLSRLCPDDIVQTIANIFDCENMILGIETPTSLRPSDVRAIL